MEDLLVREQRKKCSGTGHVARDSQDSRQTPLVKLAGERWWRGCGNGKAGDSFINREREGGSRRRKESGKDREGLWQIVRESLRPR